MTPQPLNNLTECETINLHNVQALNQLALAITRAANDTSENNKIGVKFRTFYKNLETNTFEIFDITQDIWLVDNQLLTGDKFLSLAQNYLEYTKSDLALKNVPYLRREVVYYYYYYSLDITQNHTKKTMITLDSINEEPHKTLPILPILPISRSALIPENVLVENISKHSLYKKRF